MIEILNHTMVPESFTDRSVAGETVSGIRRESLAIGQLELLKLHKISEVLSSPEIDSLVEEGKLTLGIIKPHANEGKNLPPDDQDAAEKIMDEVGRENIVFSFSALLSSEQIEEFYSDIKEYYSGIKEASGDSVWDTINNFAQSGPLTFMLIYKPEGDAVGWWRNRMGKTRATEADPESIRGKYAIQEKLPNNLTHGSDSIDSVKKEIGVLRHVVSDLETRAKEVVGKFPSEELMLKLGILNNGEELLRIERVFDSGQRTESWIYAYKIDFKDLNGVIATRYIKEENNIPLGKT